MSSNSSARPTTPTPSSEVILARAMLRARLEQGWAPPRKSNQKNLPPLSTVPTVLSRRLPSGGLAYGMFPSKEARRQALFELDMVTAYEETQFDGTLIDYLEEEIVEEPAPKRLKKEGPQ